MNMIVSTMITNLLAREDSHPATLEALVYPSRSTSLPSRFYFPNTILGKRFSFVLGCMLINLIAPVFALAQQPKAFAGAQGFGAMASGGRGGDVYHVTKLSDDGSAGTLRHGITSAAPRTIVFDIGGVIHLDSRMYIRSSNLTIAGQTAPGGGITIAGYPVDVRGKNIVMRYLRVRLGDFNATNGLQPSVADAIQLWRANRVILDHMSVSWGMDETVSIQDSTDVTLQHSIVAEGLYDSFHPKGIHSMGLMMYGGASDDELANRTGGITIYQNLLAHHKMRNPVPGGGEQFQGVDFINNVIYDWGTNSGHNGRSRIKMNYVGNYLIAGPNTTGSLDVAMKEHDYVEGPFYIYFSGNVMDIDKDKDHDGLPVGREAFHRFESDEIMTEPFPWPEINNVMSAETSYKNILNEAGASLVRDSTDERIIREVKTRSGRFVNSQEDVGGLGTVARGVAPIDTDRDGMPDAWETAMGLDPEDEQDRNGFDLSPEGYTNLEVYLESIIASASRRLR